MLITRPLILAVALAGAPTALAQSYSGQPLQMVPRPTPDADALAAAMRRLGANPRDLSALIEAGELSLRLGDVNAAAALFKRAEMVDPMNGRVKAGMARILVTQQRPGEALRYFDQATGYGLDPASFAGDRALAYDLIGEQERAQRDYRVALKLSRNDEVERRYALSLGISGKRDEALSEIDAQVRRNDRSAWRIRAFVLAMNGDVPGAEKIAATMMPPGMGTALAPFFSRLVTLPPIDRAFAVHFGELRASPQRLADARMAPPLPVLAPEPRATQVAAVAPPRAADPRRERQRLREEAVRQRALARQQARARRGRRDPAPVVLASATPPSVAADTAAALQPPRYGGGVSFAPPRAVVQTLPTPTPAPPPAAVAVASASPPPAAPSPAPASVAISGPPPREPTPASTVASVARPLPQPGFSSLAPTSPQAAPLTSVAAASTLPTTTPSPAASVAATPPPSVPPTTVATAVTVPNVPSQATGGPSTVAPSATSQTVAAAAPAEPTPVAPRMSEDSILARIMSGISIPAAELGVAPVRPQPPTPEPGTSIATAESIASAETARRAAETARTAQAARAAEAATRKPVETAAKTAPKEAKPKASSTKPDQVAATTEKPAKPDPKKVAAERKLAAEKKAADTKKAADAKKAVEEARIAKTDPPRIWVQVAGGANERDLPKAWASAKSKAAALNGKAAYSTPLRATNRVVTGPFKTDAEARTFVNTLAKQGVSAFTFTSEKGQKMTKLTDK
ncbi:tetratricopeptide repeat protein [Sphingomonas radiodurans]|uniref:tetratricopeptide repeat protein n=1 Tax=Sphingomonas radiodurans TaxID=2890321 RepID=UPI001E50FBE9|nr:tetratricopeptide repeat protein [Sphingomonas radiodurans]WBH15935.1 SPOR domain-containing protein [Sphingomonas radiodurans]